MDQSLVDIFFNAVGDDPLRVLLGLYALGVTAWGLRNEVELRRIYKRDEELNARLLDAALDRRNERP